MVDIEVLVLASVIVVFAAILQSVTGFGFALILVPMLTLAWEVKPTVAVSTILSTVSLMPLVWRGRRHVRFGRLSPMLSGSAVGVPVGIILFTRIPSDALQAVVGAVVITATLLVFALPNLKLPSPDRLAPIAAGVTAGILRGATSMGGPPATLYLLTTEKDPIHFRATMTWFLLPQGLWTVLLLALVQSISGEVLLVTTASIPSLMIGLYLGGIMLRRVDVDLFRLLACALLLVTALFSIVNALM
jgi:uncharacterized membrane protein YfcA